MLLATVRDRGLCPCPRCLVPKPELDRLGQKKDDKGRITRARTYCADLINVPYLVQSARKSIYEKGFPVASAGIERVLRPLSLVPTTVSIIFFCLPHC